MTSLRSPPATHCRRRSARNCNCAAMDSMASPTAMCPPCCWNRWAAALGGVDAVAFTGGIGEHSATIRTQICQDLEFLGLRLDAESNRAASKEPARISANESTVQAWVIPTNEALQIARETYSLLRT